MYTGTKSGYKRVLAAFLLIFVSLCANASGGHDAGVKPGRQAFTNPSDQFPMPPDWVKKPIVYEGWAKNADIAIALEQHDYDIILPIVQKYAKDNNLKIEVREATCGIAAGMLLRKAIDMGGFCCPAGKEDRLPGLKFHTLGIVGKAFLVHNLNPVENVSVEQLRNIFRGRIYKWSELKDRDGKPGPEWNIKVVGRLHCQARPGHWRLLLDNDKQFSPRMQEVGSIPDMISTVAGTREAVGWEVLSMVEKYKKTRRIKALRINGYSPNDSKALASGKYGFYRTYNITTWEGKGIENPKAQKLVEYLIKELDKVDADQFGFVSHNRLRKAGWKFKENELVGEPR